jgi:prevent-host-death family protein
VDVHWQVQEAKQRFSELLRKAQIDGPQYVTKHGKDVAVVIDIEEYHRLSGHTMNFKEYLESMPKGDYIDFEEDRHVHDDRDDRDVFAVGE